MRRRTAFSLSAFYFHCGSREAADANEFTVLIAVARIFPATVPCLRGLRLVWPKQKVPSVSFAEPMPSSQLPCIAAIMYSIMLSYIPCSILTLRYVMYCMPFIALIPLYNTVLLFFSRLATRMIKQRIYCKDSANLIA